MKESSYISSLFKNMIGLFQKNMFFRNIKSILYYVDGFLLLFVKKNKTTDSKKKKIIIIYNLAFGDGVIFRCSAQYFKKIYPKNEYEITLLCQKGIDKLYKNDRFYDTIIPIDFNKSTVSLKERFNNFKKIRQNKYDIAIDPVGISEMTTNVLYTRAVVADRKIGYIDSNLVQHCSMKKINKIYSDLIILKKKNVSLIEYYNYFVNQLDKNKHNFPVMYLKTNTDKLSIKIPKNYFIVFPSASMNLKRWHIDRYAALAKKIYKKTHLELVIVGSKSDKEAIDEFISYLDIPYTNLYNKTSIDDYINIIKHASLVVTNDTSAYHIAVIEETPVAIITGGYTYYRYVEYKFPGSAKLRQPCIVVHDMKCFNCQNRCKYLRKGDTNWPCLEKITINYAWKVIDKFIEQEKIGVRK